MRVSTFRQIVPCGLLIAVITSGAAAVEPPTTLADYFGFKDLEIVNVGRSAGPVTVADMNGNGLNDLIIANNHLSRIELHVQRADASPETVPPATTRVNEFPEHWRFKRETVSVAHEISSIVAHDFDGDGLKDLIYAGRPSELVFLRQVSPGRFDLTRRQRVTGLSRNPHALIVADVVGDSQPELIAIARGQIHIWPMEGDRLGQPVRLSAGENIEHVIVADFSGNGRLDVAGIIPEDGAPVRIWFGEETDEGGVLGPQTRFEMPSLRTAHAVRLPGIDVARLAVIEQSSRRLVILELDRDAIVDTGEREAAYHVHSFTDPGSRDRDLQVADLNGNGLLDVITTDTRANAVVVYWQEEGRGLTSPRSYPSLSDLKQLEIGRFGDETHLFVLSEREGVVGRSRVTADGIEFPRPLSISDGATPISMGLVDVNNRQMLAVVVRDGRDHAVDLLDLEGGRETIQLENVRRAPETIVALDANQNGLTDILLLTRDQPMTMLQAGEDGEGFRVVESREMGQYGLVQAAVAENTAVFDINGDGHRELLLADRNYIRALRYDADPPPDVSPGWQVVSQINAADTDSQLVSVSILGDRLAAADRNGNRIVIFERVGTNWSETEALHVRGFSFEPIHAGAFAGDGQENLLAVGRDGFAVIRLAGERLALREIDAWRSPEERQLHFLLASGDVNDDGFMDLIAIDAGEQMCDVFTFSESGRLHYATGFQVFESRLFTGGAGRQFQPNQVVIADVTGNGANDLIMVAHDRVLIYPQMTEPRDQR